MPGWASVLGITSLLFAMLFFMLGVIGEYIGRILIEVRGRPRYVVAEGVGLEVHWCDATRLNVPALTRAASPAATGNSTRMSPRRRTTCALPSRFASSASRRARRASRSASASPGAKSQRSVV